MGRGSSTTQSSSGEGSGIGIDGDASPALSSTLSDAAAAAGVVEMGAFITGVRPAVSRHARRSMLGMMRPRQPTRGFLDGVGKSNGIVEMSTEELSLRFHVRPWMARKCSRSCRLKPETIALIIHPISKFRIFWFLKFPATKVL